MANTNTTGSAYYNMPAYIALTGTSQQKIPWCYNDAPVGANQLDTTPTALFVTVPQDLTSGGAFDLHPFVVRLTGRAAVVTTATVTVGINMDSSMTYASGTLVSTTGASASITGSATAFAHFHLEAHLLWNSTPASLLGWQQSFVGNVAGTATIVAPTALTTQTLAPASTGLVFSPVITYSAANLASKVYISEFSIERV